MNCGTYGGLVGDRVEGTTGRAAGGGVAIAEETAPALVGAGLVGRSLEALASILLSVIPLILTSQRNSATLGRNTLDALLSANGRVNTFMLNPPAVRVGAQGARIPST